VVCVVFAMCTGVPVVVACCMDNKGEPVSSL